MMQKLIQALIAAAVITSATASGLEAKGVWSTGKETTLDFILAAVNRCVSGDTMRSFSAIRNQVGFSRHAGLVIGSPRHFSAIGFCVAAMRAVSGADASGATAPRKASTVSQRNPSASGCNLGALGWGGNR